MNIIPVLMCTLYSSCCAHALSIHRQPELRGISKKADESINFAVWKAVRLFFLLHGPIKRRSIIHVMYIRLGVRAAVCYE